LLGALKGLISERKLRLFGIACCRRIWRIMKWEDCRQGVLLAERLVEEEVTAEEAGRVAGELEEKRLATIHERTGKPRQRDVRIWCLAAARSLLLSNDIPPPSRFTDSSDLLSVWEYAAYAVGHFHMKHDDDPATKPYFAEHRAQANLLREIVGYPARPVA